MPSSKSKKYNNPCIFTTSNPKKPLYPNIMHNIGNKRKSARRTINKNFHKSSHIEQMKKKMFWKEEVVFGAAHTAQANFFDSLYTNICN